MQRDSWFVWWSRIIEVTIGMVESLQRWLDATYSVNYNQLMLWQLIFKTGKFEHTKN